MARKIEFNSQKKPCRYFSEMRISFPVRIILIVIILIFLVSLYYVFRLHLEKYEKLPRLVMVLELDNSGVSLSKEREKKVLDQAIEIYRNRLKYLGLRRVKVNQAGEKRIMIEVFGIEDTTRASQLAKFLEQRAYLEFKLVKPQNEFHDVLKLVDGLLVDNNLVLLPEKSFIAMPQEGIKATTSEEFNPMALFQEEKKEGAMSDSGKTLLAESIKTPFSRLFFQEPYVPQSIERHENYMLVPANNIPLVKEYLSMPQVSSLIDRAEADNLVDYLRYKSPRESSEPDTLEILLGDDDTDVVRQDGIKYKHIYLLKRQPEITGSFLADANATLGGGYDPRTANKPLVLLKFDKEGADSFETITERFIQRDLSIVLDKVVIFAPRIMTRIPGGNAQIEGVATMDKARDLSIVLRAGALSMPIRIVEFRIYTPDSVSKNH